MSFFPQAIASPIKPWAFAPALRLQDEGVRAYSSRRQNQQQQQQQQQQEDPRDFMVVTDYGLLSTWLPRSRAQRPPLWTSSGIRSSIREWKGWMHSTLALGYARWNERKEGFSPSKFRYEAKEIYEAMNTSFAEKDLVTLRYVCADAQYSKLKNEIKRRPKGGRLSWSMQGEIIPPRIVAAYIGNLAQDLTLFQIVVRLKTKQSVALYDEHNRLMGGDPNKAQEIEEYVVFEKTSGDPKPWRVYGKVPPPQADPKP
ncbi:MAG: Tim44-like domain-containing protein [Piptocephalis tieghemiana]|nr:MAG: Tim44-like domain-containing protein [Piptocephalis tieghemiana]